MHDYILTLFIDDCAREKGNGELTEIAGAIGATKAGIERILDGLIVQRGIHTDSEILFRREKRVRLCA